MSAAELMQELTSLKERIEESRKARQQAEALQAETMKELARKENRLRTLVRAIPDMVWLKDVNGLLIFCNAMVESFIGVEEAELIGKSDAELFAKEIADVFIETDRRTMAADGATTGEIWLDFAVDGHRALCELITTPMRDADGKVVGVLGIARDITERNRTVETLKETLAELARVNAELEQFAYVASHDLQEPLRMVSSYTQLLARRYQGRLDADADEFIAFAVDGANRMQSLINDLLAYSRVGTRSRKLEPADLAAAFAQALANLKAAIDESGAVVTHDSLPTLRADKTQMAQLFQNLIGNAIKFHGAEPPRIHVTAAQEGDEWTFSVHDNGIGIDPQHGERVFTLFHRLHGRNEYPGTGIGLAICKKTVERHGGRIWLESELGKGSAFYFTIATGSSEP